MSVPVVTVSGLTKRYGSQPALDGLSFEAATGEITAILGPNGAGKTTALEICQGFQVPDSGSVRVLGLAPAARSLRSRVGVMPQSGGTYQGARVGEVLDLFASFYANPLAPAALLDRLGLTPLARRTVKRLSGGEAQRLSLAMALVGRPELLFLDEPTASLDVKARHQTWELMGDLKSAGVSVILTTHYIEEAESLADHVVIIDDGRAIASGTPGELAGDTEQITFRGGPDLAALSLPTGLSLSEPRPGNFVISGSGRAIDAAAVAEVTALLAAVATPATHLRVAPATLEETFLQLTGRSLEEPAR